jgi:translation initiation factor RLI1
MTAQELETVIENAIEILQENKQAATPEMLGMMVKLINAVKQNTTYQEIIAAVLECDIAEVLRIIDSINQFEQIEEKLVLTNLSDQLIQILTLVKGHTFILSIVAALL